MGECLLENLTPRSGSEIECKIFSEIKITTAGPRAGHCSRSYGGVICGEHVGSCEPSFAGLITLALLSFSESEQVTDCQLVKLSVDSAR